jgi:hypothetical protein
VGGLQTLRTPTQLPQPTQPLNLRAIVSPGLTRRPRTGGKSLLEHSSHCAAPTSLPVASNLRGYRPRPDRKANGWQQKWRADQENAMKIILWIVGIIFVIGLLVVFGVIDLIF